MNMADKLSVKRNALEVLEKQLSNRAKKGQYGIIVLSSATDPYLQFEKEEQLTRKILGLILKYRFPLHVITKSDLVVRDLDLLSAIDQQAILPADLADKLAHRVFITFSFSTVDNSIARIFEPGATPPDKRLESLRAVLDHGFHSGVSMMPLIPYISDTTEQLERAFTAFKQAGVNYIFPATITLFGNDAADGKQLVFRAIEKHYPQLVEMYNKLFINGSEMPEYYKTAFYRKMKELCEQYGLKDRIL